MGRYGDFILIWCMVAVGYVSPATHDTLRVTQVVFRHGNRSPLYTFPTDPNQEDAWPQGLGQLTLKGIEQEYKLGQRLRQHYNGWLNDTYINKEILVTSTGYDRTLVSAEAVLAGLYPPVPAQKWNPDIDWQPIPIHTRPLEDDHVLYMDLPCDRYTELEVGLYLSDTVLTYLHENQDFFEYMADMAGLPEGKRNFIALTDYVGGPLYCEKETGLPLADWVTPEVYDKAMEMILVKTQLWYALPEQQKLKAGRWMFEAFSIMTNITQGTGLYTQKIFLNSAHESTMTAFQLLLGVWDWKIPPYSSFFALELHEPEPEKYTVKFFYKNDTNEDYEAEPMQLFFPDCPDPCSLEDFEAMVGPYLVSSDEELAWLCAHTQQKQNKNIQGTTIALVVIVVFAVVVIVTVGVVCCRKRRPNPYQKF